MDEAGKSGNGVEVERGLERLDVEFIYKLLRQTHWARNRSREVFERAIRHSLCFGAYEGERQVGFARVVTDHATFGYIQDFIVDPASRGRGIGRSLLRRVLEDPIVSSLRTLLLRTETAHGLYRNSGFARAPNPQDLLARYLGEQPTNSELSTIHTDRVQ
jgi:ribosomal protein S18 acetylase RimI-like enzyme